MGRHGKSEGSRKRERQSRAPDRPGKGGEAFAHGGSRGAKDLRSGVSPRRSVLSRVVLRVRGVLRIGSNRPVLRAVLIFGVLMGLFYTFVHTPLTSPDLSIPHLRMLATSSAEVLRLFGYDTTVAGTTIHSPEYSVEIVRGCDAIEPTAVFVAIVLATPVALWTKAAGLIFGIVGLLLVNFVRIVSLFFIGIHFPSAFELIHETVWQVAFVAISLVFWAIWVQWATRPKREQSHVSG